MIKVFASFVRWLLLNISLILLMFVCVTRIGSASEKGAMAYGITLLAAIGYLAFSLICLLIGFISRIIKDDNDAMIDTLMETAATIRNKRSIDCFRKIAFWGCIILLVALFLLKVPFNLIYGGPYESDLIQRAWHGLLLWSLITYPVMIIISSIYWALYMPHFGEGTYTFFQHLVKELVSDITEPIEIVRRLFDRERENKLGLIIDFVVMIFFILLNIAGIIKTII